MFQDLSLGFINWRITNCDTWCHKNIVCNVIDDQLHFAHYLQEWLYCCCCLFLIFKRFLFLCEIVNKGLKPRNLLCFLLIIIVVNITIVVLLYHCLEPFGACEFTFPLTYNNVVVVLCLYSCFVKLQYWVSESKIWCEKEFDGEPWQFCIWILFPIMSVLWAQGQL